MSLRLFPQHKHNIIAQLAPLGRQRAVDIVVKVVKGDRAEHGNFRDGAEDLIGSVGAAVPDCFQAAFLRIAVVMAAAESIA